MLKLRMHPRVTDVRIKKIMLRGVPKFSKKRDGVKAILKVSASVPFVYARQSCADGHNAGLQCGAAA